MRILLLILTVLAAPAVAQPVEFAQVHRAMEARDWDAAARLAADHSNVSETLVTWTRLRAGTGRFPEYLQFLEEHPHWPGLSRMRRAGERTIDPLHDPQAVVDYFGDALPQTGEGAVQLASALRRLDRDAQADAMLILFWQEQGLDEDGFDAVMLEYAPLVAPSHAIRADALLWRWRTADAAMLLPYLPEDQAALVAARVALIDGDRGAMALVAEVPDALRDDAGLANAMFNRLANSGDYSDATTLLMDLSASPNALGEPFRWASWRASLARWALREGRPAQAYAIADNHHLSAQGRDARFFADLEWLAGYISLRHLDKPQQALGHFTAMSTAVSGPISTSRAEYWTARTFEALGNEDTATTLYAAAARHQTAFYGLLAAEKLGLSLDPTLAGREQFADWRTSVALQGDLAVAAGLLLDVQDRGQAVLFVAELARTLDRTALGQLGDMLTARDEPWLTVLVGKTAVGRDILLPAHYFPLHPLAEMDLPVSAELALSIARRESEFNYTVGSPVGALGLMQLMPATAQEVAGSLDLPYSRARLTSDWPYNATLGAQYLAGLTETFGASPVMIAAGYNAGPSRPRTWMTQRGDPRDGEVDVIDWIEMIPFTETRNYVMRVTESLPVYRARLYGSVGPIQFTDMLNGAPPFVRPVGRPAEDEQRGVRPRVRP